MLVVLFVGLLVLIGCRALVGTVIKRRWPRYLHAFVSTMFVGLHALLALAFAWMAYLVTATEPLHLALSSLFVVFGAYEAGLAIAGLYVLAKPSAS
jgi:hypothetical protein